MDFVGRFKENAPSKHTLLIVIIFTVIGIYFYVQHIHPLINPKFLGNDEFWPKDSKHAKKRGTLQLFWANWCQYSTTTLDKWQGIQRQQKQKHIEYLSKSEDDRNLKQTDLHDLLIDRSVKLVDPVLVDDQNEETDKIAIKVMESALRRHNIKPSTIDRFPTIYFISDDGRELIEFSADFNEANLVAFLKRL